MATREKSTGQDEKTESRALATTGGGQLPAEMLSEMEGLEGAGTSAAADDNVLPLLSLLQDMSPEVKRRDDSYVEGAEPGCLLNKATRRLYAVSEKCVVIPVYFDRAVVEWIPRDKGGGYVARHMLTKPTPEETMLALGARAVPDPKDTTGRKVRWVMPSDNELIDTRYHYVMVEDQEHGTLSPAVVGFSSTGHQSSRAWMTLMRQPLPGKTQPPPSWFRYFNLARVTRKNPQGEWYVIEAQELGYVLDGAKRAVCRQMHEMIAAGTVRAAAETEQGGAALGGDIPI